MTRGEERLADAAEAEAARKRIAQVKPTRNAQPDDGRRPVALPSLALPRTNATEHQRLLQGPTSDSGVQASSCGAKAVAASLGLLIVALGVGAYAFVSSGAAGLSWVTVLGVSSSAPPPAPPLAPPPSTSVITNVGNAYDELTTSLKLYTPLFMLLILGACLWYSHKQRKHARKRSLEAAAAESTRREETTRRERAVAARDVAFNFAKAASKEANDAEAAKVEAEAAKAAAEKKEAEEAAAREAAEAAAAAAEAVQAQKEAEAEDARKAAAAEVEAREAAEAEAAAAREVAEAQIAIEAQRREDAEAKQRQASEKRRKAEAAIKRVNTEKKLVERAADEQAAEAYAWSCEGHPYDTKTVQIIERGFRNYNHALENGTPTDKSDAFYRYFGTKQPKQYAYKIDYATMEQVNLATTARRKVARVVKAEVVQQEKERLEKEKAAAEEEKIAAERSAAEKEKAAAAAQKAAAAAEREKAAAEKGKAAAEKEKQAAERQASKKEKEAAALRIQKQNERKAKEAEAARRQRAEDKVHKKPEHWTGKYAGTSGYALFPLPEDELKPLRKIFELAQSDDLGKGRDVKSVEWMQPGNKKLQLACGWRIENPSLLTAYNTERDHLQDEIKRVQAHNTTAYRDLQLDGGYTQALRDWFAVNKAEGKEHMRGVNEVFLLHGTKPETLLQIIANGPNEKFSGGLFGEGTYFAENPAKNDQYTAADPAINPQLQELHDILYRNKRDSPAWGKGKTGDHPGQVYYIILCRVAMGVFVPTMNGATSTSGDSLWAREKKVLAQIPGLPQSMPCHYHSMVAEKGASLLRFREFMQFQQTRIYPAYLLAYWRVKDGERV